MQSQQSWGRWQGHPQPASSEYGVMGPSSMMPYDARTSAAPVQQPAVAPPQYMVGNAYSMAPVSTMPAPNYQTHHFPGFQTYAPPSPPSMVSSYKPYQEEHRQALRLMPIGTDRPHEAAYARDDMALDSVSSSPSVRHALHTPAQSSTCSDSGRSAQSKDESKTFENHTDIDNFIRVLQARADDDSDDESAEAGYPSPPQDGDAAEGSAEDGRASGKNLPKKHRCPLPGCKKKFGQKTHLIIHIRSHTGEKPYRCTEPGCGLYFSQMGNLKTHQRRHTGEKPFECQQCGKKFAQRGNVRAHMNVHDPTKRFHCRLDGCNRPFTQRGNLKSHQNRFHADTVKVLTAKFAAMSPEELANISADDRELFEDFRTTYKNLNKGIKGRGKGRNVAPAVSRAHPPQSLASQYPVQQPTPPMHAQMPHSLPQLPQLAHPDPQQQHAQHHHPHGLPAHPQHHHPAAAGFPHHYDMMRHGAAPGHHHALRGYDMFDVDHESGAAASTPPGPLYEEDHARSLPFVQDHRLY